MELIESPKKSLSDVLASLGSVHVAVVGDVMLDRYSFGRVDRISPEAPVPVMQIVRQEEVPGGAANVYANIAMLGVKTTLVGIVGDDEDGRRVQTLCDAVAPKVGEAVLLPVTGRVTTTKHRMVAMTQQVLRVDTEDVSLLPADQEEGLWQLIRVACRDASVIVVADYAKGMMTPSIAKRLVAYGREQGKLVVVDTKPQNFIHYTGATLFTPNEKETRQLFPDQSYEEAGKSLANLCQAHILSTRGAKGMQFFPRPDSTEAVFSLEAFPADVRDVSGAGDTVTAVAAIMLAHGLSYKEAADVSNRAASVVVAKTKTATLTRAELLEVATRPVATHV